jgi:hypothetical protein
MAGMTLIEAVEYIRNNEAYAAALAELQEVREVLDSTSKRRLPDGPCWCKSYLSTLGHTEDCQRARALMEKLEVRP